MMRLWLLTAIALLALPVSPASAVERMLVTHTAGMDLLGAFVAKDQGYFDTRGLDVDFRLAGTGGTMVAAVVSNSVQASNATIAAMLFAADQGLELCVIGPNGASAPGHHMAALLMASGSEFKNGKGLEGHTVAVPGLNAFLHLLLVRWLREQGADVRKVHFVEITFPQMPDALRSKRVDAATLIEPFVTRALSTNSAKLLSYYTDGLPDGTAPSAWVTSRAYAETHREAIRAFQAALRDGIAYARAHPEVTDDTLSRYLKLPIEAVRQAAKPRLLDEITPARIGFWIDLMREQGLLSRPLNSGDLICK
jgi:NitT/TauT family transport system substrate-binding protein